MQEIINHLASTLPTGETSTGLCSVRILKVVTSGELVPEVQKPVVSLILQGEKRLLVGNDILHYRTGDTYAAAFDLPTRIEIMDCSPRTPYLAVALSPDPALIADLMRTSEAPVDEKRAYAVHSADTELLDAYRRLLNILERPDEVDVLGPLIEREILFRLLKGPQGAILRKTITGKSGRGDDGIGRAIALIRARYTEQIEATDLAQAAGMSLPTFYRRFKAETGMSPLQYRTRIRLYEARGRILAAPSQVASLAFDVGYDSASQFSREYAREFGAPPKRDAARLLAAL